jgi:hypothetical protein
VYLYMSINIYLYIGKNVKVGQFMTEPFQFNLKFESKTKTKKFSILIIKKKQRNLNRYHATSEFSFLFNFYKCI